MKSAEHKTPVWQTDAVAQPQTGTYAAPMALIARCLRGDEQAYALLYKQYATMIYRLNYSLLNNQQDAEEVLQDTFEYAFRRLDAYDVTRAGFKTWLYQIAVSRCRNKRRRKWLPTLSLQIMQETGGDIADTDSPTPDELSQLNASKAQLLAAVAALSPKLRETAILRYYEGLNYREIGEILGIGAKTAESRMRLAHKSLRKLMTEGGQ